MISWFDQLNSTLVAAGAVLIVGGLVTIRASGTQEGTRLFAAQSVQRSLTDQLQIDLDNLGIGRSGGVAPVIEASATRLAFHGVADTLGTAAIISYDIVDNGGDIRVTRSVDGVVQGGTHQVLEFTVELQDASGNPVASPTSDDLRAVSVHVERKLPFVSKAQAAVNNQTAGPSTDGSAPDPSVGWTTTVRPMALQYRY